MNTLHRLLALPVLALTVASAHAGNFADITLDGNSTDWAGITASITNSGTGPVDQVFIANNDSMIFLRITFKTPIDITSNAGFALAIDSDNSSGTGFNTYGANAIGSDALYIGETPYKQISSSYTVTTNTAAPLLITNYQTAVSTVELGITRSALIDTDNNIAVFQNSTIKLAVYFEGGTAAGSGSTSFNAAEYTFASSAVPEPSTYAALAGFGALTLAFFRRRR